jgi:hypothetical protein
MGLASTVDYAIYKAKHLKNNVPYCLKGGIGQI